MDIIGGVVNPSLTKYKTSLKEVPTLTSLRISKVQKTIIESEIDAVLLFNGVDSRYNPDFHNFTNFILFGCSNYKNGNFFKYLEHDIDELILVIQQHKVQIYLTPSSMDVIFPLISKIHNLEIHCLDSNLSVDDETVEDHKVYSFISMTKGIKKLAIPFCNKPGITFNAMDIEKWPLIQAYALENYGSNGFFGLSHELVAFNFENEDIFNTFDTGSLKHLLTESCLLLKYQWNIMIQNILNSLKKDRSTLDIKIAAEPLSSYLSHGNKGVEELDFAVENHAITKEPFFVTCLVKEPQGSLECGRTYFVHDNIDSADVILVSCIYSSLVMALHKSIQRFISTHSDTRLSQYFTKKFGEKLNSFKYPQLTSFDHKSLKIKVSLNAFDIKGRSVSLSDKQSTLKSFNVRISNIISLEDTKVTYKDIVFEETFIDSQLNVRNDEATGIDTEFLVVTDVIPINVQWNFHCKEKDGQIPCSLFSNDQDSYDAFFSLNASSIEITSNFSTPLELRFQDIKELKVRKASSVAVAVHLDHSSNCLPPFLKRFCLIFWQRGKGCKFVYEILLTTLKESGVALSTEPLPSNIALRFDTLVTSRLNPIDNSLDELDLIQSNYPTYSSFAPHFMLSNIGDYTYNQCDVNPNLTSASSIEPSIFITILIGIPGSNQENVCSLITDFSKEENQFIILRQPLGSPELFSTEDLQKSLAILSSQGNNPVRVMVIVSAYIEIPEVVSAIVHHPNKLTRDMCYISCINTCVDVRNMLICNSTFYPKIMEQCQEGWVNNIIVSGIKDSKSNNTKVQLLRKLNPHCNIVEVIRNKFIDGDSIVAICDLDAFNITPLPILRHLSAPGWYSLKYNTNGTFLDVKYVTVNFSGVLCKARFMAQLKSLYQKEGRIFVDRIVMSGSIFYVRGRTKFIDDDNVYEAECTPRSDAISLNIVPNAKLGSVNSKYCFVFTGYQITEEQVKTWLQACVAKPPVKKELFTKIKLSLQEKEILRKEASKEKLPEGWFYNGTSYVSMTDGKKLDHPMYECIVEKYVEDKNKEIEKFNKDVENFHAVDLFDGM